MARTSYIRLDDNDYDFVLDQQLDFHCASSLKEQAVGRHVDPLAQSLFYYLELRALRGHNKYQLSSLV